MNPFFDISTNVNLPSEELQLQLLNVRQISAIIGGRRGSSYWGTSGSESKTIYTNTTSEDYDKQFSNKLLNWKPIYDIHRLIEYHYHYYTVENQKDGQVFLQHMQYVILPILKKAYNGEVCIDLFEKWLDKKTSTNQDAPKPHTVNNNTINNVLCD